MESNDRGENRAELNTFRKKLYFIALISVAAIAVFLYFFLAPAGGFPSGKIFKVTEGESLSQIASNLRMDGYIRSRSLFKLAVVFDGHAERLRSGEYYFDRPLNPFEIARRLARGISGIQTIRITIPEGFNLFQIANLFEQARMFNQSALFAETGNPARDYNIYKNPSRPFDFSRLSQALKGKPENVSLEGYIFPDTYFVNQNEQPQEVLAKIIQNFNKKVSMDIRLKIKKSGQGMHEILTMASMLEEEATSTSDRKIISGILWKRLKIGMALQVDPTVRYATGKFTGALSVDDYKFDSLFNTYKYRGLPPGPISNPGLDAIEAALEPTSTSYFYYLSGKSGIIHYAKTFEEHKLNKGRYLK